MSLKSFKDKAAIVGVGNTPYGQLYRTRDPLRTSFSLGRQAFKNALADSGLRKEDIDGVIVSRIPSYNKMCYMLGLNHPRITEIQPGEGRMSGVALQYAAMAVYSGMANAVACIYGNDGRTVKASYGAEPGWYDNYNSPYGMSSPGASWAFMWRRYMHEFNVPEDALGPLAILFRKNASMNPDAVMQTPLTMEKYLNTRYIAYPLRLFDYCLINDGGVCFIVTSAERAKDCRKAPVYITGTAQVGQHTSFYHTPDFNYNVMKMAAEQVYPMAGVEPKDIDCAQIYDNFLPNIPISLEGFGFCARGEGARWIRGGRIALGGELPVNTSGGHCSESYMQGWALHVEAVRQLRGECGPRQVKDCELVQFICNAPITTTHILRR
jgi:acetyl-CoA acetyltransferase